MADLKDFPRLSSSDGVSCPYEGLPLGILPRARLAAGRLSDAVDTGVGVNRFREKEGVRRPAAIVPPFLKRLPLSFTSGCNGLPLLQNHRSLGSPNARKAGCSSHIPPMWRFLLSDHQGPVASVLLRCPA